MAIALHDLLQPQVILDVVSRILEGQGRLSRHFGFSFNAYSEERGELSGANSKDVPVRHGTYRIFDRTRTVASARAPGVGPATWQPQPVGEVNYTLARFHEKIVLEAEELMNLSPILGPQSAIDSDGQDYARRQLKYLVTRVNNGVELMAAGMIRGVWYLRNVGDNWIPTLTQPAAGTPFITVNHQIPAGNLGQLNMLGAGNIIGTTWSNPAAPILSNDLPKIAEAMAQLTGYAMTDVLVNPTTWALVIQNTEVQNTAGSAMTPFDRFEYEKPPKGGPQDNAWGAVLKGYPTLRWHVWSQYLVADGGTDPSYAAGTGTLTPVIPANGAVFMPQVDPEWVDLMTYREAVSERMGEAMAKRASPHFWMEWTTQPTSVDLLGLMNCMPRLRIPKAIATATVVF